MKYSYVLPAIVATAYAQDRCQIVAGDASESAGTSKTIALALIAINSTTNVLEAAIGAFQGTDQVGALATAGVNVLTEINKQNAIIAPEPVIADDDPNVFTLSPYVGSLGCSVQYTVDALIAKKQLFVNACIGPVVLQNIQQQQNASTVLQTTIAEKIPEFLKSIAGDLAAPLNDALSSGASAFADQTTLPASCGASSTSATGTSATATGSSSTITGGAVYPTATGGYGWSPIPYPTEENNSYPASTGGAYPTASAYPTHPAEEEDCEEEEYVTKTGGAEYPTGGKAYPTGGAHPTYPAGSPSYPVNPSMPVNPSLPVTTGYATKPATSSWAVWTTSSAPYKPVYTGGAAANAANFGAVAFAVAAAAML